MIYNRWGKYLHSSIKLVPVEFAGRGTRFREPFYESFEEAIEDIYFHIEDRLMEGSFSFLGHSMGSVLVYEIIHKHKKLKKEDPAHVFFSGRYPPHIHRESNILSLPDEEFLKRISWYGGTPKEVFENVELRRIVLPILRADYKIMESYEFENPGIKMGCDITILNGKHDETVQRGDLNEWHGYTDGRCDIHEFEGGHFFINDYDKEITDIINNKIAKYIGL